MLCTVQGACMAFLKDFGLWIGGDCSRHCMVGEGCEEDREDVWLLLNGACQ